MKAIVLMLFVGARECAYEVQFGGDVTTTGLAVIAAALRDGLMFAQAPEKLPDKWSEALALETTGPRVTTSLADSETVTPAWRRRTEAIRAIRREVEDRRIEAVKAAALRAAAEAEKAEPPAWEPALNAEDETFDAIPKDPNSGVRIALPGAPPRVRWLAQAYLDPLEAMIGREPLDLVFEHGRDGSAFNANAFHEVLDGKGPTVTLILTARDNVFGALVIPKWTSRGVFMGDPSRGSFLFTMVNSREVPPTKFPIRDASAALWGHAPVGPCFGFQDLAISGDGRGHSAFPCGFYDTLGRGRVIFDDSEDGEFEVKLLEVGNFEDDAVDCDMVF
jgi:hypothetical protein